MVEKCCKRCGKKLDWVERRNKYGLCRECVSHCSVCGRKLSIRLETGEREFASKHDGMCPQCWMKGKEHEGEKSCGNCTYCVAKIIAVEKASVTNLMQGLMGGQPLEYDHVKQYTCTKFGFDVTDKLSFAEKCTSYLTQEEYEQKCLSGELHSDLIVCPYCQTKYDKMKQPRCPNCGAFPKK